MRFRERPGAESTRPFVIFTARYGTTPATERSLMRRILSAAILGALAFGWAGGYFAGYRASISALEAPSNVSLRYVPIEVHNIPTVEVEPDMMYRRLLGHGPRRM